MISNFQCFFSRAARGTHFPESDLSTCSKRKSEGNFDFSRSRKKKSGLIFEVMRGVSEPASISFANPGENGVVIVL
tara:strand:- start:173 stop:400 length:228 start_codon:yes stop_codon:yes gene_type:complete